MDLWLQERLVSWKCLSQFMIILHEAFIILPPYLCADSLRCLHSSITDHELGFSPLSLTTHTHTLNKHTTKDVKQSWRSATSRRLSYENTKESLLKQLSLQFCFCLRLLVSICFMASFLLSLIQRLHGSFRSNTMRQAVRPDWQRTGGALKEGKSDARNEAMKDQEVRRIRKWNPWPKSNMRRCCSPPLCSMWNRLKYK